MKVLGLIVLGLFWLGGIKAEITVENCDTITRLLTQPSGQSTSWLEPTATSGGVPLTATKSPDISPPVRFNPTVSLAITYTWEDNSSNTEQCVITLYVVQAPAITVAECAQTGTVTKSFSLPVDSSPVDVTWTEPTATLTATGVELEASKSGSNISPGYQANSPAAYTVIYYWTDGGSNTAQCTVTLQVVAQPAITVMNCYRYTMTFTLPTDYQSGETVEVSWTEPTAILTATGAPLIPSNIGSISSGSRVSSPGSYTVTYIWSGGGSVEQCTISLAVVAPPAITVMNCDETPMLFTLPTDYRTGGVVEVSWIEPTAILTSTGLTLPHVRYGNAPPFTTSIASTSRITYSWTDGGSYTELCIITLQVVAPPIFYCEETPMEFTLPPGIGRSVEVTWTEPLAIRTNAPGNPTLPHIGDVITSPFSSNVSETFHVIYTWDDGAGYVTTCNITLAVLPPPIAITVEYCDETLMEFTLPADYLPGGTTVEISWVEPTATLISTGAQLEAFTSGSSVSPGVQTSSPANYSVTYLWRDEFGNTEQCTISLTVVAPPVTVTNCVETPMNFTLSTGFSGSVSLTWIEPTATLTDGLEPLAPTKSVNISPGFTATAPERHVVIYTWSDGAGYSATCSVTFIVSEPPPDTEAPVILDIPMAITVESTSNEETIIWTAPSVSDNYGEFTLTSSHESGSRFLVGLTTVTYTATDYSGNSATASFNITIEDIGIPVISGIPSNIVLNTASNETEAIWTEPSASDNSGIYTLSSSYASGFSFPIGVTNVTYTAIDSSGNLATATFMITVQDAAPPECSNIPDDITQNTDPGQATAVVTWVPPTVTDNSGVLTTSSNYDPGDSFAIGTTMVIYTATDSNGLTNTCAFDVIVTDTEDPVLSNIPNNIVLNTTSNETVAIWTEPSASDNSGIYTLSSNYASGVSFPIGITTVTYTAIDPSSNTATAIFTINIQDIGIPVISGIPSNIVLNTTSNETESIWTEPSASDNSGIYTLSSNYASGFSFPIGVTTVTYTAIDPFGNMATATFMITVQDVAPPECSDIRDEITRSTDPGQATSVVTWPPPTITDNSGVFTTSSNYDSGDSFGIGTTMVIYTATDSNGLTNTCAFDVIVTDTEDPVLSNIPNNIVLNTTSNETVAMWTEPSASDNSGIYTLSSNYASGVSFPIGITTVTYTAIDPSSNIATAIFTINIQDATAPQCLAIPDDISLSNDPGLPTAVVTWTPPTFTIDSGEFTTTSNYAPGDSFTIGRTVVVYNATDSRGVTNVCSFTVIVTDLDECDTNSHNCDVNATCTNTEGSYNCTCNEGYIGNGFNCTDDCNTLPMECDTNAYCNITGGSYNCTCNEGYTGDGFNCTDVDECDKQPYPCDANASCNNTKGSYNCICNERYLGDGFNCTYCDAPVGWDIRERPRLDHDPNMTVISLDTVTCAGVVTQWRYQAEVSRGFRAMIWRQVAGSITLFQIVGINDIPAAERINNPFVFTVPFYERIEVEDGDMIGWSLDSESGVFPFDGGALGTRVRWNRSPPSSLRVNQTLSLGGGPQQRAYSLNANIVPGSRQTTCVATETLTPFTLTWPEARVGETVDSLERCPVYSDQVDSIPRATRLCQENLLLFTPMWQIVITNKCFDGGETSETNDVLLALSETMVTSDNVDEIAFDLSQLTNVTGNVSVSGLVAISSIIENIVSVQTPSHQVTTYVIETVENILDIDDDVFLRASYSKAPTRILQNFEAQISFSQTTHDVTFSEYNSPRYFTNIDVYYAQLPPSSFDDGLGFASISNNIVNDDDAQIFINPNEIPLATVDVSIVLPTEIRDLYQMAVNDTVPIPVTFVLYQDNKLFQSRLLQEDNTSNVTVGSRIISATVEGLKINKLEQPVVSTFLLSELDYSNQTLANFTCVFWDFDQNNGSGDWSADGCEAVDTSYIDRVVCHCYHLTSFAVLIDVHGQTFTTIVLDFISKIGCGISITALIVILITYLSSKSLRAKTPQKILICLSLTLLCLYLVFLIGVDRNDSYSGCIAVAVLLHYLTLATVAWMGVEAVSLYLLIIKVFGAHVSHFMLKACLVAWGGPLIPVVLVLAIDKSLYYSNQYCFMQPGYAFYFADLLLIFLVLTGNVVIFIMVTYKLTCGRKDVGRASDRYKKQSITRAVNAIAISALLGLTWVFGFLTIIENRESSLAFQVLFCLFNSLQGLFIFLLFCVRSEAVRKVWKSWFSFGKSTGSSLVSTTGKTITDTGTLPKSIPTASSTAGLDTLQDQSKIAPSTTGSDTLPMIDVSNIQGESVDLAAIAEKSCNDLSVS